MERRILTELFVEDDRAIEMDKGTIDYAKDVIDYQCQECGISTGQMRILDDDDSEDVKASDLADKIFNLEESKLTFVYVVKVKMTLNGSTDTDVKIFSTHEKAKVYFDECVADEKANDHLMLLNDKVVIEEENCFYIYEDSHWYEPRYQISIEERMVH